jgi:hypothetical protein
MTDPDQIIALEPGCRGKAHVLEQALLGVICSDQFGDMTLAEVLGVLELVKLELVGEHDTSGGLSG